MKPYLLALILFISCSKKETIEKPKINPVEKSVTYLRYYYGTNGNLDSIRNSVHWCRVCCDELKPYLEQQRTNELICDSTGRNRLILVIDEPCLSEHKKY